MNKRLSKNIGRKAITWIMTVLMLVTFIPMMRGIVYADTVTYAVEGENLTNDPDTETITVCDPLIFSEKGSQFVRSIEEENNQSDTNSIIKQAKYSQSEIVSEEKVYESLIALKTEYPEGTSWSDDKYYYWKGYNPNDGVLYAAGYGCVAFSFMMSDAAFGDLPARYVDVNFDNVRVGDILRINEDTHDVIVLEVHEDYLVIAEGNYNNSVHWGRKLTKKEVNAATYILTRYPEQSVETKFPFKDVPSSEWYYYDVKQAYESGLINGMNATTFAPNEKMTYAQAVKLAACMNQKYFEGRVTLENGSPNWWDSYVNYAWNNGIISKTYDWNAPATRAGYVEIFANSLPDNALPVKNTVADNAIPDVEMSHPQATQIYKLYRAGILTGMDENGTFSPNSNIRRSEVSAILTRMMNENERKDLTLDNPSIPVDLVETETISDSWEQIIASIKDGTYKRKYNIGDTKSIDLGPEGVIEMQIAAFDADELADGSGKAAITWISKQLLKSKHRMNPEFNTNIFSPSSMLGTGSVGGWEHSEMRMWLESEVKSLIPLVVRNSIKPVIKTSNSCDTSLNFKMNVMTVDDIWIPSYREVFGEADYNETKGVIYNGLFTSDSSRQKKINGTENVSWWLLRSASYDIEDGFTIHFCYGFTCVDEDGTGCYISFAEDPEAVAIGFCM